MTATDIPATTLQRRLRQTVRDKRRFFAARALVSAGVVCLVLAAGLVVTDVIVAFGPAGRWSAFGLLLLSLGCMLAARLLLPCMGYHEHEAVREIESACPTAGQLIRTSADVARYGDSRGFSPALSRALIADAEQAIQAIPPERLLPWQRVRRLTTWLAVVAACFVLAAVLWPDFRKGTVRLVLPAAPITFTEIDLTLSADQFRRGESVDVRVTLSGRSTDDTTLFVRSPDGSWAPMPLTVETENQWSAAIGGRTQSFALKVHAGDARTEPRLVEFIDPPEIREATVTLTYPEYTGMTSRTMPLQRIVAVEGTVATLTVEVSHALQEAWIREVGTNRTWDLDSSSTTLTHAITVTPGAGAFELGGHDAKGWHLETLSWEMQGVPDHLPTLTVKSPKDDLTLTKLGEFAVDVLVEDDVGLAQAEVVLSIDGRERVVAALDEPATGVRQAHLRCDLRLEDLPVQPGSSVRLHARARDRNPRSTGWGVSEIRLIEIQPLQMLLPLPDPAQAESAGASAEELQEQLATLEEAIDEQKEVLEDTLRQREEQPDSAEPMQGTADTEQRLAQTMEQLLGQQQAAAETGAPPPPPETTPEGATPTQANPLEQAAHNLDQAARDLLEPDLAEAMAREDLALAAMMKARNELQEALQQSQTQPSQNGTPSESQQPQPQPPPQPSLESLAQRAEALARQEGQLAEQAGETEQAAEQTGESPQEAESSAAGESTAAPSEGQSQAASEAGQPPAGEERGQGDESREQQEQALAEAQVLEDDIAQHAQATPLATDRMRGAREQMNAGLEALAQANPEAPETLREAERQLDDLADHLEGLDPANAAETLERASRMARQAAEQLQSRPSDPTRDESAPSPASAAAPARPQDQAERPDESPPSAAASGDEPPREPIARDAETIDDWLETLAEAPTRGMEQVQQALREVRESTRPADLADRVRHAETERELGRPEEAEAQDRESAQQFESLAHAMETQRDRLVRSRLEQLAAAEQNAKQLQREARNPENRPAASGNALDERLRDFADDLQELNDEALEEHAREIRQQLGPLNLPGGPQQGDMVPETVFREALPGAEGRLRTLIDDIIQRDILVDRDATVPEAYRSMVERYFQALSDDQQ